MAVNDHATSNSGNGKILRCNNAIDILKSRRRQLRPDIPNNPSLNGPPRSPSPLITPGLKGKPALYGMKTWLRQLGHDDTHINSLNAIHVAGTKGKGSTCMFVDSFLRAHRQRTGFPAKCGLYVGSPMRGEEERICIDSKPITRDMFTKYFFEVWETLSSEPKDSGKAHEMPRYLQLLALVSFHTFIREGVAVAIYETHKGGEFDSTNIFDRPVATGITTLGLDHVKSLGPSIENIAWHKSGIMKTGSPAFSAIQDPSASEVLKRRAKEVETLLRFVDIDPALPTNSATLKPTVQRKNCSLALALTNSYLKLKGPSDSNHVTIEDVDSGVEGFFYAGRFHRMHLGNVQWFLDGAHNEMSVGEAARWYASTTSSIDGTTSSPTRILIFLHISHERDGSSVLHSLATSCQELGLKFQHIIFSNDGVRKDGSIKTDRAFGNPDEQNVYAGIWNSYDPIAKTINVSTMEEALQTVQRITRHNTNVQVLVTGSLHLVSGIFNLLEPAVNDAET